MALHFPHLRFVLCCAVLLACAPALAQPASPSAPPAALAPGQVVFGILGQPLHAAPDGAVIRTLPGAPALLLEEGPAARDGRRWFRVLTSDLSQGWLPLAADVRRAPAELRATSGQRCSPDDDACRAGDDDGGEVKWEPARALTFVSASRKPRCLSAAPCLHATPWLRLTDGKQEGWVDAAEVGLTWEPVDAAPAGRECALHLAFGLQGLVKGPFLRREEWAGLTALVQVPSSSLGVSEPIATVTLSSSHLSLVSTRCRRQEFATAEEGLVDLAAFQCISPDTCQHALLLEARHRSGHREGSVLYVIDGQSFQLPQVRALELGGSGAEGANAWQGAASWWVEHSPQGEGGTLWIVRATKELRTDGKAKPPRASVEQVTVGPVDDHPEHPAHPTPRAFQAILLAEGASRDELAAKLSPLEACLGRPVPRFEVLRSGRWSWAAGRLFETAQQAAAWKAAVHRCGMKQGFTYASIPNATRK
jgi:hypothetical protein